jgi:hypothetical protein
VRSSTRMSNCVTSSAPIECRRQRRRGSRRATLPLRTVRYIVAYKRTSPEVTGMRSTTYKRQSVSGILDPRRIKGEA